MRMREHGSELLLPRVLQEAPASVCQVGVSSHCMMDPRETDASSVSSERNSIVFELDGPSTSNFTPKRRSPRRFTPTSTPQKKPT